MKMGGNSHSHHVHHPSFLCGPCHSFGDLLLDMAGNTACSVAVPEVTGECAGLIASTFQEELAGVCALLPVAGEMGCQAAIHAGREGHWEQYVKVEMCKHLC